MVPYLSSLQPTAGFCDRCTLHQATPASCLLRSARVSTTTLSFGRQAQMPLFVFGMLRKIFSLELGKVMIPTQPWLYAQPLSKKKPRGHRYSSQTMVFG